MASGRVRLEDVGGGGASDVMTTGPFNPLVQQRQQEGVRMCSGIEFHQRARLRPRGEK